MLILFDLAGIAFFIAIVLTPLIRNAAARYGWVDKPDETRKIHRKPIPRVGGIGVAVAFAGSLILVPLLPYGRLNLDLASLLPKTYALFPAAAVVFLTGLLDDIFRLRPWQKLAGLTLGSLLAYQAGFGVFSVGGIKLEPWIAIPVTVLWLVGTANALNLVDGMDGLAAGVGTFAAITSLIAALMNQSNEMALVAAPLAGALLGFLRYNFNPASVFLGDSGSLLVGFLLGAFGAMWGQKSATLLAMTAPLMAMAVPLLEVALSIFRRGLRSQPIFSADRGHIHHHLLDQGLTPRRAVLAIYATCGTAAAFALLQEIAYDRFGGLIIVLFCVSAWIGVQHLGYAEFGFASHWIARGAMRRTIDTQMRLQEFERALAVTEDVDAFWRVIAEGSREFGFHGARMVLLGRTYEYDDPRAVGPRWQLRVPLPDSQYINLSRKPGAGMHQIVLVAFPEVIERVLKDRWPVLSGATEAAAPAPGKNKPGLPVA